MGLSVNEYIVEYIWDEIGFLKIELYLYIKHQKVILKVPLDCYLNYVV